MTRASASSSSLVRPPPFSSSILRSARRSRRSPTASAPPIGDRTVSTATSGSSASVAPRARSRTTSSSASNGRTATSSRTGRSVAGPGTGTPAAISTRRKVAVRPCPRTMTAISDHGMPNSQVRLAQLGGDVAGLLAHRAQQPHVDLATGASGRGTALEATPEGADLAARPWLPRRPRPAGAGMPWAAPGCAAHRRRVHRRAARPRGSRSTPGQLGPAVAEVARVGAAEGLHGAVGVAEQDQVEARSGHGAQQPRRGRGELLGVVDDHEAQPVDATARAPPGPPRAGRPRPPRIHAGS